MTDALCIDYINRFWMMDVDARVQLFDLKTTYSFVTTPAVDRYNMPMYSLQTPPGGNVNFFPVYQGFLAPCYINGVQASFTTQQDAFYSLYPNIVQQNLQVGTGDGTATYPLQIPQLSTSTNTQNPPFSGLVRGHVDMYGVLSTGVNQDPPLTDTATIASKLALIPTTSISPAVYLTTINAAGQNMVVTDSGLFLSSNINYGALIAPGAAPYGHASLGSFTTTTNSVNYLTGQINVTFPSVVPDGQAINAQVFMFNSGLPRTVLFYNNTLTFRSPPDNQYLVEITAYLSPSAFLSTSSGIPFAYMSEYIARGAARKILSDTGDVEQLQLYEPFFREQESLVWKRSQRQATSTRTPTIYSTGYARYGVTNPGGYPS